MVIVNECYGKKTTYLKAFSPAFWMLMKERCEKKENQAKRKFNASDATKYNKMAWYCRQRILDKGFGYESPE